MKVKLILEIDDKQRINVDATFSKQKIRVDNRLVLQDIVKEIKINVLDFEAISIIYTLAREIAELPIYLVESDKK